ncbi:hypothetical protein LINPERPRIM_LOCUS26318 [Linum perenne]
MVVKQSDQSSQWPRKNTMHIINELTSLDLIVHCRSKDDDLGAQVVHFKPEFSWSFTGYGFTLFWCNVGVQDKRTHFVAFDGEGLCTFHWVVDDTGVHMLMRLDVNLLTIHGSSTFRFMTSFMAIMCLNCHHCV